MQNDASAEWMFELSRLPTAGERRSDDERLPSELVSPAVLNPRIRQFRGSDDFEVSNPRICLLCGSDVCSEDMPLSIWKLVFEIEEESASYALSVPAISTL